MKKNELLARVLMTTALSFGLSAGAIAADKDTSSDHSTTAGEAVTDGWITTKIKAELGTTKDLKSTDISVETNNGIATLTGTVPSDIEHKKAVAAAESVKGVKSVDAAGLKVKASN